MMKEKKIKEEQGYEDYDDEDGSGFGSGEDVWGMKDKMVPLTKSPSTQIEHESQKILKKRKASKGEDNE